MQSQWGGPHGLRTRCRTSALAALAAATLTLTACGGDDGKAGDGAAAAAANGGAELTQQLPPAKGEVDRLTWALPMGEPASIDPTLGSDYSPTFVTANLCDTLLRQNPDFSVAPSLATKWEQPDDKTLVFTLRDDVTFWDGAKMTSEDVAYSLNRAARPESYVSFLFASVDTIRATGPHEVTVKFKTPDALFAKEMATGVSTVVQKKYAEQAGERFGSPKGGLMCSGPFELESWTQGKSIELTRNDAYWDEAGRAKAKAVTIRFLPDSTALAQALISGEVDGAYEIPAAIVPGLQKATTGKIHQGPSTQYLEFSVLRKDGPLANPELRRAIFASIDRDALAKVVFHDTATANYTLLSTNSWDRDAKELWEQAYAEHEAANKLDLAEAKKIVEQEGATGQTLTLVTQAGDATQSQLAQLLQETAKQIGLAVKIRALQPVQFSEMFVDPKLRGDADLAFVVAFNGVPDPLEPIPFFVQPGSIYNTSEYEDPQVTKLLEQAKRTLDAQERSKLLIQAQAIYEQARPATSLLSRNEVMFLSDELTGAITSFTYLGRPSLAPIGAK